MTTHFRSGWDEHTRRAIHEERKECAKMPLGRVNFVLRAEDTSQQTYWHAGGGMRSSRAECAMSYPTIKDAKAWLNAMRRLGCHRYRVVARLTYGRSDVGR